MLPSFKRSECNLGQKFQCATTGLCLDKSLLCDGKFDCSDLSDECNCPGFQKSSFPIFGVNSRLYIYIFVD